MNRKFPIDISKRLAKLLRDMRIEVNTPKELDRLLFGIACLEGKSISDVVYEYFLATLRVNLEKSIRIADYDKLRALVEEEYQKTEQVVSTPYIFR
jgi:hypothetical protein